MIATIIAAAAIACVPARDAHGHIARDRHQVTAFRATHPCPATGKTKGACPGYVVDHITPLCACGPDLPSNMQWQSKDEAKEKDKLERRMCGGNGD